MVAEAAARWRSLWLFPGAGDALAVAHTAPTTTDPHWPSPWRTTGADRLFRIDPRPLVADEHDYGIDETAALVTDQPSPRLTHTTLSDRFREREHRPVGACLDTDWTQLKRKPWSPAGSSGQIKAQVRATFWLYDQVGKLAISESRLQAGSPSPCL